MGTASGGIVEAGLDEVTIHLDSSTDDSGSLRLNALCGMGSECVPDEALSCAHFDPNSVAASGEAGFRASENASGGSGIGGTSSRSRADGGESGEGGRGGESGGAPLIPNGFGCQIRRDSAAASGVVRECAVVGLGESNAPCLTSSDCQAGYGCVADHGSGLCQRYCCRDTDACDPGTYCAERPLRDAVTNAEGAAATTPIMIPVCAAAENCDLRTPYPCPAGVNCACQTGTACLVVRSDGTTTCTKPGKGKVGDACPCAWNHVCSAATKQCVGLCYTRDEGVCGAGKCQSSAELPDGWGVCVGG